MEGYLNKEILNKINNSKSSIFFKKDFINYKTSTINKILSELVKNKILVRVSKGIYVRTRINKINNKTMFDHKFGKDGLLMEILDRLNIKYEFPEIVKDYQKGKNNQIPVNLNIIIKNKNFKRKINLDI
jgi:hypothetical protein